MSDLLCSEFVEALNRLIDKRTETKVIECMKAIGLRDTSSSTFLCQNEPPVSCAEAAEMLGFDVSSPTAKRKAVQRVQYLVRAKYLPGVRLSPRNIVIRPQAIRDYIASGGKARAA